MEVLLVLLEEVGRLQVACMEEGYLLGLGMVAGTEKVDKEVYRKVVV